MAGAGQKDVRSRVATLAILYKISMATEYLFYGGCPRSGLIVVVLLDMIVHIFFLVI